MLKSDFSTYPFPQEALRKSLNVILDGGAYLTPRVAKQILQLFTRPGIAELIQNVKDRFNDVFRQEINPTKAKARLTRMQLIVLQELAEGKSTAEIARQLQLKENTINTHIKGIYNILEVNSRTKAIRKAVEKRLIKFAVKT
jgi:DNA-binding NarL/FixJ family response regulator